MIQLLAAIAILLLLAVLFYPVLDGALRRGMAAKALGNLRKVASAFEAYRADHGGRLPQAPYDIDPAQGVRYFGLIPEYLDDLPVCPLKARARDRRDHSNFNLAWGYGFASNVAQHHPTVTSLRAPLDRVFLYAECWGGQFYSYTHFEMPHHVFGRHHDGGLHVIMADMSAKLVKPEGEVTSMQPNALDRFKDAPSWMNISHHPTARPDGYYFHQSFFLRD